MSEQLCASPECSKPVFRKGLCRGHYARPKDEPLAPRKQTPWERLVAAAIAYADGLEGTDREAWQRARDRLRKAAAAYGEALASARGRSAHRG